MEKLNIDTKKHMGYSKSADSDAIRKHPPEKREKGLLISKDWR